MPVKSELIGEAKDIRSLLGLLKRDCPTYDWVIRDSEYDGFYIRGRTELQDKFRIVEEGKCFCLEFYYSDIPENDAAIVFAQVKSQIEESLSKI